MTAQENKTPDAMDQGKTSSEVPFDENAALEKLTKDLHEKKMHPKDAMGLSDDMVEGMYGFGYRLYNTGKYDQALQLFRLLVMLDPSQTRFSLGLAACFHMMKDYQDAATTYVLCSIIDGDNPLPHYHASDCYIQMGQPDLAIVSLELCIERCEDKKDYATVKERAQLLLEGLRKQMAEKKEETAHEPEEKVKEA